MVRLRSADRRLHLCAKPQIRAAACASCRHHLRRASRRLRRLSCSRAEEQRGARLLLSACPQALLRTRRSRSSADRQARRSNLSALYAIESEIRGRSPDQRRDARQEKSRPILDALEPKLREKLALISQKTKLAEAIRYVLSRWDVLMRFINDGRIEIDSNIVERVIRPIALNRKKRSFRGFRWRGRELGDRRVVHRDMQAQWRRSADIHDRRSHEDRRRPSREQTRRTHAVSLPAAHRPQSRDLKTTFTNQEHGMTKRSRRTHSSTFKARIALAVIKGENAGADHVGKCVRDARWIATVGKSSAPAARRPPASVWPWRAAGRRHPK